MPKAPHQKPMVTTPQAPPKWMKMKEVYARLSHMSRQTVLRLVKTGKIPGGELLFTLEKRSGHKSAERWVVNRQRFDAWDRLRNIDETLEAVTAAEPKATKVG